MQRAIGMVEFTSIARGIYVADQMVKISEVEIVSSTTSCPGKYITIVTGDVAAVKASVAMGEDLAGEFFVDSIVIPNVSDSVFPAIHLRFDNICIIKTGSLVESGTGILTDG